MLILQTPAATIPIHIERNMLRIYLTSKPVWE